MKQTASPTATRWKPTSGSGRPEGTDSCARIGGTMDRRTFLELSSLSLGSRLKVLAEAQMPMATLGKSGLHVSRFCLGGYHMGMHGEENGVRMIRRAVDLGVNLFDSAHHYNEGRSDEIY